MKKIIALFLLISMLIPAMASCSSTPAESSGGESSAATSSESEVSVDYTLVKAGIDNLYTSEVDRSLKQNNIFLKKNYTASYAANKDYPDTTNKLTNGEFAKTYYGSADKAPWAGFYTRNEGDLSIEIDLGATYTDIADIGISFCNNISTGIAIADKVEFYAFNNTDYVYIGAVICPKAFTASDLYKAVLRLQGGISTSKIKIVCKHPRSTWLFVDEVFAYQYKGENTPDSGVGGYYGNVTIPSNVETTYWSETDADYNKSQNLLAKLPQQIISLDEIPSEFANTEKNSPATNNSLTDGIYASSANYSSSAWFRITRGLGRQIIYDLGKTSAVSGYSFGFLKEKIPGIKLPQSVSVEASENYTDWQTIYENNNITSEKDNDIVRLNGSFSTTYRARFIRINIPVSSHIYIDELQILGTKNVGNAKAIVKDTKTTVTYPNKYASPDNYNGVNDVLLSYICHPDVAPITKDTYLPYVAYIKDGVITDTLFDSFLFLPYVAFLYDGSAKKPLTKADWQLYMDTQFTAGSNMDALEAAVEETKTKLGNSDYKANVFLSIIEPVSTQTAFGEVNGKNLDFTKLADKKAAVKWFIDEQLKTFKSKGYKNLNIQGFYWFTEEIDFSDGQIKDLISYATDYVRSLGYITSWIPYYQSSGYSEWKSLGFDLACYQPNYAFDYTVPDQRLLDAAEAAKLLGMCIELEIGGSSSADVDRLKKYYTAGANTGFMTEALHMYYQGGVPGSIYNAYTSKDAYIHSLYDDTYKFIKGTYNPSMPAPTGTALTCSVKDSVSGTVSVTAENKVKGLVVSVSPKYGTVQLNVDGSYTYTPFTGITGEDYFEISVNYGYGISEPARITVTVS